MTSGYTHMYKCLGQLYMDRYQGGGELGARSPPAFHILAEDMSLSIGVTHFTLGLRPFIIPSFLLQIYLVPFYKLTSCAPVVIDAHVYFVRVFTSQELRQLNINSYLLTIV